MTRAPCDRCSGQAPWSLPAVLELPSADCPERTLEGNGSSHFPGLRPPGRTEAPPQAPPSRRRSWQGSRPAVGELEGPPPQVR